MIPFPYEKAALADEEMPPGLDIADALYYTGLRLIFKACKNKTIDKPTGAKLKNELYRAYVTNKGKIEFLSRAALGLSERISKATAEYLANPSLETADAMYKAFYNIGADPENTLKSDNNLTTNAPENP